MKNMTLFHLFCIILSQCILVNIKQVFSLQFNIIQSVFVSELQLFLWNGRLIFSVQEMSGQVLLIDVCSPNSRIYNNINYNAELPLDCAYYTITQIKCT